MFSLTIDMKMASLRILILFETFFPMLGAVEYFGSSDQFVCHCADPCVPSGECSNCEPGWMGPACQYANLAYGENAYITTAPTPLKPRLIDNKEYTCSFTGLATRHTVRLIMEESKWLNWVQIVVRSQDLEHIQQVRAVIKASPDTPCSLHVSQSGPVYDFLCDQTLYSSQVDFYIDLYTPEYIYVCEIRINGGMNVAVKKPAIQTSDFTYQGVVYPAELAVDGNTDRRFLVSRSCSHTDRCISGSILAWEVDLQSNYNVHIVKIYNRQGYEDRLRGFTLSTRTYEGDVRRLYKDNLPTGPGQIITTLSDRELFVHYVTITIPRCQNLALCEVEVFSTTSPCLPTNYGFDCQGKCNCKNASESCEKIFGFCASGCLPGYQGAGCKDVCPYGFFGDGCTTRCNNCIDASCDPEAGRCNKGCSAGWRLGNTSLCDTRSILQKNTSYLFYGGKEINVLCLEVRACQAGTFGPDCNFTCNCRDPNETCNTTTGSCLSKCPTGYQEPSCQRECEAGRYGNGCNSYCSRNCLKDVCGHEYGVCLEGCKAGYRTDTCNLACEDENYGVNCSETCSVNCRYIIGRRQCQIGTGRCHGRCKNGWRTPTCKEKCLQGRYGYQCKDYCSINCEYGECNNVNGSCFRCIPGRYGSKCEINCEAGTFGQDCMYNCSEGCKGAKCHSEDGVCKDGCTAGWKGDNCSTPCDEGFYGENCASVCGDNCEDGRCNHVDGVCLRCTAGFMGDFCSDECPAGLYGTNCEDSCSDGCDGGLCNGTDGSCTCGPGWTGQKCDEVIERPLSIPEVVDIQKVFSLAANKGDISSYNFLPLGRSAGTPGFWRNGTEANSGCVSGYYGYECVQVCSSTCADQLCEGITGQCQRCQSGWSGAMCTESTGMSTGLMAGIVVACILILILAVIIAVFIFRRRPDSENDESVHFNNSTGTGSKKVVISKQEIAAVKKESSQSSLIPKVAQVDNTGDEYYNIAATSSSSTVVSTRDFPQFVRNMRTDKNQLYKEFQKLPRDMIHDSKIALSAENISKNRYKNICAYDHSRVILKLEEDKPELGDYINACYIDTPRMEKAFIAAQGPNDVIIKDFVRMLWQLNIRRVVMLTNLFEEGKQKCHQYWPDEGESLEFGDITVSLKEIKCLANYTIRKLTLAKDGKESRHITQFHYTVWPDKGVPTSGASLIDFREKVIPTGAPAKSPIVVHCSAGVGRTGTFIALQCLKEEAEMSSTQDIYTCVWRLRQQRVNMVQTKDQYVFLHETSLLSLTLTSSTYSTGQFVQQYPQLDQQKIEAEFKVINEFPVKVDEAEYSVALKEGAKNRSSKILAGNSTRPILVPNPEYEETMGTYINAVFLPSYENAQRYIQTQTPLPSTVVDIWRLVQDHGVSVIVMLDFYSQDQGDVAVYWPEMKLPLHVGPYGLECVTISQSENIIVRNLQLKQDNKTQSILHLTAKFWPDDGPPAVSSLLQLVRMATETTEKGPIIVHCRNGVDRSGLFCAVSAVIERIKGDNSVAIPQVVSDIKAVRKQNIPNLAQYKLCYEAAAEYLGAGAVYENSEMHARPKGDVEVDEGNVYTSIAEEPIYSNQ